MSCTQPRRPQAHCWQAFRAPGWGALCPAAPPACNPFW